MSYLGVPPFGQTVRTITESLATAGQTTFSPSGGYLPGYIDVFLNGSALGAADFTATNGSTVVLNVAAALNDEFKAIAYWPVSLIDTYRKAEADALLAARVGTTSSVSMRNRIINGDMRIDQRNAGASVTVSAANTYCVDRIPLNASGGGVFSAQQSSTAPAGFANSLALTVTTPDSSIGAVDNYWLGQKIEGYNVSDLGWGTASASPVTLTFWVRSSVTGTYSGTLNNNAYDRSYIFTYTINSANTWEQKTVVVPGDTTGTWLKTNGIGMYVIWSLGCGSTYSSSTTGAWLASGVQNFTGAVNWIATSGATFYITGVQLEAGTVASPFERRDYGRELMMCQRYYQRFVASLRGYCQGTTFQMASTISFPVQLRVAPAFNRVSGPSVQSNLYGPLPYTFQYIAASGTDFAIVAAAAGDTYAYNYLFETTGVEL